MRANCLRGWTSSRPGPIAATRLLDLEDGESELPAEDSGGGGEVRHDYKADLHGIGNRSIIM